MNIKLIIGSVLSLVLFISFASPVKAFNIESYPKDFKAGWNLITFDYFDSLLASDKMQYAYAYDPRTQKYVGGDITDTVQGKQLEDVIAYLSDQTKDVLSQTYLGYSFFVYLDEDVSGITGKKLQGGLEASTNTLTLLKGWNFIANLKEFKGKSFNDFKGTCVLLKTYAFDNMKGDWNNIDFLVSQDDFDGGDDEIQEQTHPVCGTESFRVLS